MTSAATIINHLIDFDFDFNILTAFIRLGRAGPRRGPGALHIMILTLIWRRGALHIHIYRLCAHHIYMYCTPHILFSFNTLTERI
jgi:hypothetical protein